MRRGPKAPPTGGLPNRFEISFDSTPAGFAWGNARAGEKLPVLTRGYATTDDSERLHMYLDGFTELVLSRIPNARPEGLAKLVAIVRRDNTGTVFVNDAVRVMLTVQGARDVREGDPVLDGDILDIRALSFVGIDVAPEDGVVVVLSHGWRRAAIFDLMPVANPSTTRDFDLTRLLGEVYAHLAFQDRIGLSDAQFEGLAEQGWFPFVGLGGSLVKQMVQHLGVGWQVDDLLPRIKARVLSQLPALRRRVESSPHCSGHKEVLERGFAALEAEDHLVCCNLLYPRIEGLLRSRHLSKVGKVRGRHEMGARKLVASATADPDGQRLESSLLLPGRFERYLLRHAAFSEFDPNDPTGVSRHTIGHGVAPVEQMNEKASLLAVLTLDQLLALVGPDAGGLNLDPNPVELPGSPEAQES